MFSVAFLFLLYKRIASRSIISKEGTAVSDYIRLLRPSFHPRPTSVLVRKEDTRYPTSYLFVRARPGETNEANLKGRFIMDIYDLVETEGARDHSESILYI